MRYKKNIFLTVLLLASCSGDDQFPTSADMGDNTLIIQTKVNDYPEDSKAIVTGNTLPNLSQIGVTLLNSSDAAYDGKTYSNIKFTLNTSDWLGASDIYLSPTSGKVYAYYPWVSGADITALTLTANGLASGVSDYMYATSVTVSQTSRTATLTMNHALSAVTVNIKKGTYTGTCKVTALTFKSATLGTSAKLNAKTGALYSITGGNSSFDSKVSSSAALTLTTSNKTYQFLGVPTGTAGGVVFSITMDGQTYSVTSSSITMEKGKNYTFNLTMDAKQLSISGVTVTGWTAVSGGSYVPSRT